MLKTALNQEKELQESFSAQPMLIKQYESLQQKLNIARDNLSGLISAREKFQLEIAQNTVPWKIIKQPEIDKDPLYPSYTKNLAFALIAGSLFGLAAALLRQKFDNVFHNSEELKEMTDYPIIGRVPFVEEFKSLRDEKEADVLRLIDELNNISSSEDKSKSAFFYKESIREIITSLKFLSPDNPLKIISFCSSLPREGKSIINLLIAYEASELGYKVLLIDGDMKKPQIHKRLKLNNIIGFSNALTDLDNWEDAVQKVKNKNEFYVMTSGTKPPDSGRIINTSKSKELFSKIKTKKI